MEEPKKRAPIQYSKEDKQSIQELHLLTGFSYDECKEFLEGLAVMVFYHYIEDRDTHFPLLGDLYVGHVRDKITKQGKEAQLSTSFEPDSFLKRIIGQVADGKETDIEKQLRYKISRTMQSFLNE